VGCYYFPKELLRKELNELTLLKLIKKYQKARDIFREGFAELIEHGIVTDQTVFDEEHSLGHELFSTIAIAYGKEVAYQFGLVVRPEPEILKNAYLKACSLLSKKPNEILMTILDLTDSMKY
jgi:3-dehydroquinate synthetase